MRPSHDLLRLPGAADTELRAVARAHPRAMAAAHASRSYRAPLALVAWHDAPLGVDIERVEPCEHGFGASICTPAELELFSERLDDERFVASLWSGKEALAKALGDPRAYDPRRLDSPLCWDDGASGRWRAQALTPAPGHVAWLVWSAGSQNSPASAASADSRRFAAGRR